MNWIQFYFTSILQLLYLHLVYNYEIKDIDIYDHKNVDVVVEEAPAKKAINDITEFPQRMVLTAPFLIRIFAYNDLKCSGTLLKYTWIITAAQCVYRYPSEYIRVQRYGDDFLKQIEIARLILHENFKREPAIINDVALLEMRQPFARFNDDSYKPLALPSQLILDVGTKLEKCIQYALDTKKCPDIRLSTSSNQLRVFEAKTHSYDRCKLLYPEIKRSQLCVTVAESRDLMGSELGAPLVCQKGLYGIFSFYQEPIENLISKNCNETTESTKIYSRIDVHYNWIRKAVKSKINKKSKGVRNNCLTLLIFVMLLFNIFCKTY